ncbi:MAG: Glycogen synthase [uncultured bacterium]|nr:MAG: Glycogen synthase [uncultured bacterium]
MKLQKSKYKILFVMNSPHAFNSNGIPNDNWLEFPMQLAKAGYSVSVFQPYFSDAVKYKNKITDINIGFTHNFSGNDYNGRFLKTNICEGLDIIFLKNDFLFTSLSDYLHCYYSNNYEIALRLSVLSHAVFLYMKLADDVYDFLNCVGWEAGLVPALHKKVYCNEPIYQKIHTIFSVYSFMKQGNFDPAIYPVTGLSWASFNLYEMEFWGKFSFMKGGVVFSDALVYMGSFEIEKFFSPRYAFGLEGIIENKKNSFSGIPLGANLENWEPSNDKIIKENYSLKDIKAKKNNKDFFLNKYKINHGSNKLLIGVIGSLEYYNQDKHLNNVIDVFSELEVTFVVAGKINTQIIKGFSNYKTKFSNNIVCIQEYDEIFIHLLMASADIIVIPSTSQKYPLSHLYALKYGVLPIVSDVFGTMEGIESFNVKNTQGNGLIFSNNTATSLLAKVISAINILNNDSTKEVLIRNAMKSHFTWIAPGFMFIKILNSLKKSKI